MRKAITEVRFSHDPHPLTSSDSKYWCGGTQPPTKIGFPGGDKALVNIYPQGANPHATGSRASFPREVRQVEFDPEMFAEEDQENREIEVLKCAVHGLQRAGYEVELPIHARY